MKQLSLSRHELLIEKDVEIAVCDGAGSAPYTHYSADYNVGDNTAYTGGSMTSHLLLPVIPGK